MGVWVFFLSVCLALQKCGIARRSDVHQKLVLTLEKEKYNKRLRPDFGIRPVVVSVSMYVGSLRSISEQNMDFKLELYFREYWKDDRLAFNPIRFSNHSMLHLHESMVDLVWVPDTFFPNAINSVNPSPGSITHRSLFRLNASGEILYSRRLSVTAECPMHLGLYPFDEQECFLSIESYGYSTKDIVYEWKSPSAVAMSDDMQLPAFLVSDVLQSTRTIHLATGEYSRLETCFIFKRSAAFYFVQLFIPSTAIVATAWLSLYMEHQSGFSDMVNVILAITFLYYSYNTVMPKVSYLKAMDIFLGTCFLFVFAALLKLAVMKSLKGCDPLQLDRRRADTDQSDHRRATIDHSGVATGLKTNSKDTAISAVRVPTMGQRVLKFVVDKHRRAVLVSYPVTFLLFCTVFFVTVFNNKKSSTSKHCVFV